MTTAKTPHRPLGLQSRMHPWLGPLIDLRTMGDQGRGYAQLVGLVQQAIPAQAFTTAKGKTLVKASVKVGDESRSYFDVTLWKRNVAGSNGPKAEDGDEELFVGDLVWIRNVSLSTFRGQPQGATSYAHTTIIKLMACQEVFKWTEAERDLSHN
eukprot:TRINITY_DN2056_c0_g4_i1.p1 TRINITY_DN2056_c0_g4~~TRINITY_DN2056_c0_g4_i1.p1  ORF type:complete len:154 (-),score=24.38 TRINITY_DN2056_c0_g4_i1:293-754(-)